MEPPSSHRPAPAWPERSISVLNGIVGDYLDRRGNGLAIAMTFMQDGRPVAMTAFGIAAVQPRSTPRLAILVHGWCCNETIWDFPDDGSTYGTRLQHDEGFTPFAVRFNSGLPLAQNGGDLARLLQALVASYPGPVDEIVLLGHSMGGLVIRAACHVGTTENHGWVGRVKRIFYIGTPHEGADLERFAHGATEALRAIPNPITRLIGNVINFRSRGVKDLRSGGPLTAAGEATGDKTPLPWLASAEHYRLIGTLTRNPDNPLSQALGDGLVRIPAAADVPSTDTGRLLMFAGVPHLSLAHDARVYAAIRTVCAGRELTSAHG